MNKVPTREIPVPLLQEITNYLLEGPCKHTFQMVRALDDLNRSFHSNQMMESQGLIPKAPDEQSSGV